MPEFEVQHIDTDPFARGYITAMFFTEQPDNEVWTVDNIKNETLKEVELHCLEFQNTHRETIEALGIDLFRIGVDYWFTRQGHGSGFWDGYPEPHATVLTAASEAAGEVFPYLGDDGFIYDLV